MATINPYYGYPYGPRIDTVLSPRQAPYPATAAMMVGFHTMVDPKSQTRAPLPYTAYGRISTAVIQYENDCDPYREPTTKTVNGTAVRVSLQLEVISKE